jgi:hypothetical protein
VKECLFISDEKTKLTPAGLIDYLTGLIEHPDKPTTLEDVVVFICGTPMYSEMVKQTCSILGDGLKCYEW